MVIGLLGTDFCSPNRGCGALGYSAIEILNTICLKKDEHLEVYAFLFQAEPDPKDIDEKIDMHYIKIKTKSISFWKNTFSIFNKCNFVLDFTGGDSFSDIYGMKRFCITSAMKELAIMSKAKFVIAPQTIGPFEKDSAKIWAKHILKKSDICFVRDAMSKEYVKTHFKMDAILTTDVAFALPKGSGLDGKTDKVRVGFNPSGLLWDGTKDFNANKHLKVDYKKYVEEIMECLCADNQFEVYLIPHVFTTNLKAQESDLRACVEIQKLFPNVKIHKEFNTPMDAKGVISSMDIFIGARMHATIAAFSTGVATIPFSYSRKFEGLYHDLGYNYLISATKMDTDEAVRLTMEWIKDYRRLQNNVVASEELIRTKQKVLMDKLSENI